MKLSISDLPYDIHHLISEYLLCSDITCLSLTCQSLRNAYHTKAYEKIDVRVGDGRSYLVPKKSKEVKYLSGIYYKNIIPLDAFLNPEKYSWFPNEYVKHVNFYNSSMAFNSAQFPYSKILRNYPVLKFLEMRCTHVFIGTRELMQSIVDGEKIADLTVIRCDSILPYLKSLETQLDSPAPMAFVPDQDVKFVYNLEESEGLIFDEEQDNDDGNLSDVGLFATATSHGYYNEAMKQDEEQFIKLKEKVEPKPSDSPKIIKDGMSSLIAVFPKPSWTDFLSFLHIKLHDRNLPDNEALQSSNIYNLCMLDNYPNLQTVRIYEDGEKTFYFSKHVYLSLNRCKKLDSLTIKYYHGNTTYNTKGKMSRIISELRGTWKEFTLGIHSDEYSEEYPWHISNPTVTSFMMDVNNYEGNYNMIFDFDKKVFRALFLKDTGIYNPDIPKPFNIIKQHADNLTILSISFLAKKDKLGIFNNFKNLIRFRDFPNVVSLSIYDYSDGLIFRNPKSEHYLIVKDSVAQYLALLFDLWGFGQFFEKTGEANKTIRLLQKATSSSDKVEFSQKVFDQARIIPHFEGIYKCYDTHDNTVTGPLPCCKESLDSRSILYTFNLLLLVFQQIEIPYLDIITEQALNLYLIVSFAWSELFLLILEGFPKLKDLELHTNVGMNQLAMLPFLQIYYKETLIPELGIDGSELDWSKLILPTYPYKDEWIRKNLQKCSTDIPRNITRENNYTHQVNYLRSLCKK